MWLISGFSGSSRGQAGAPGIWRVHRRARSPGAGSSGSEVDRATGRLRVRGSAHRSMRAIMFEAVSLRQLVFHLSAGRPLAGCGPQHSSSALSCADPMRSISRDPRRNEYTTCTAVALMDLAFQVQDVLTPPGSPQCLHIVCIPPLVRLATLSYRQHRKPRSDSARLARPWGSLAKRINVSEGGWECANLPSGWRQRCCCSERS